MREDKGDGTRWKGLKNSSGDDEIVTANYEELTLVRSPRTASSTPDSSKSTLTASITSLMIWL